MNGKDNLAGLKILVFSLGFLLAGGLVLLGFGAYNKMSRSPAADVVACEDATLALPPKSILKTIKSEDGRLTAIVQLSTGVVQLLTIDPCNGKILHTLTIGSKPPAE